MSRDLPSFVTFSARRNDHSHRSVQQFQPGPSVAPTSVDDVTGDERREGGAEEHGEGAEQNLVPLVLRTEPPLRLTLPLGRLESITRTPRA